ncbi:MAG: DUF3307 domain-containing protein [Chthoniobacteraceae bacterium]
MNDLFVTLLLGHVIGDFFLQPKALAVKKGASNLLCSIHVAIYTISIVAVTRNIHFSWIVFVYGSHWVVDRFSLADKWLQLIHSRDLPGFVEHGHLDIPDLKDETAEMSKRMNYRILRGSFSAIVYVVVDNSMHLFSCIIFTNGFL